MVISFIRVREKLKMQDKASTRVLPTMSNRKLALSFIQPQAAQSSSLRNMAFAITRVVLRASRFTSHLRSRSWGRHATLRPTLFLQKISCFSFIVLQSVNQPKIAQNISRIPSLLISKRSVDTEAIFNFVRIPREFQERLPLI